MQFSLLAVTALVGPALPGVFSTNNRESDSTLRSLLAHETESQAQPVPSFRNPKKAGSRRGRYHTKNSILRGAGAPSFGRDDVIGSILTNKQMKESANIGNNAKEECNPDVGVLACGVGSFCVTAEDESRLGGFCVPTGSTESNTEINREDPSAIVPQDNRRLDVACLEDYCSDGSDFCYEVDYTGLGKACIYYSQPYEQEVCVLYIFTFFL